jgi:hypothetical protein
MFGMRRRCYITASKYVSEFSETLVVPIDLTLCHATRDTNANKINCRHRVGLPYGLFCKSGAVARNSKLVSS